MSVAKNPGTATKPTKLGEGADYGAQIEGDESWFQNTFKDVPTIEILTYREFVKLTKKIMADLKSDKEFLEKKMDALKKLRSLILFAEGVDDEIIAFVSNLGLVFIANLTDSRPELARETCLTLAYICKEFKHRTDILMLEVIMPVLINSAICSDKVTASAMRVTLKFIFMHVHHERLISQLVQQMLGTYSREIQSIGSECLLVILQHWPAHRLEQQIPNLKKGLEKGLHDGFTEAQMAARNMTQVQKAFWAFRAYFPYQGDTLLNNMDDMLKKQVLAAQNHTEETPVLSKTCQPISTRPTPPREQSAVGNNGMTPGDLDSTHPSSIDASGLSPGYSRVWIPHSPTYSPPPHPGNKSPDTDYSAPSSLRSKFPVYRL